MPRKVLSLAEGNGSNQVVFGMDLQDGPVESERGLFELGTDLAH